MPIRLCSSTSVTGYFPFQDVSQGQSHRDLGVGVALMHYGSSLGNGPEISPDRKGGAYSFITHATALVGRVYSRPTVKLEIGIQIELARRSR